MTVISAEYPIKLDDCSIYAAEADSTALPFEAQARLYKLLTVNKGVCNVIIGDDKCTLMRGESILLFPYEKYELVHNESTFFCSYVCFALNSVRYSDALADPDGAENSASGRKFCDSNLCITVKNLCAELESANEAFSNELVSLLGSQMLVYLARHLGTYTDDSDKNKDANLKLCSQVMSFIDSRIFTMKNLREVATEMGYNYSYISTLFRRTSGTTLNAYFKTKRMNAAKRLLQDNKMSVSEIARIMNYSSVYAFSKAFKEHFGSSPGHYSGRFPKKDD